MPGVLEQDEDEKQARGWLTPAEREADGVPVTDDMRALHQAHRAAMLAREHGVAPAPHLAHPAPTDQLLQPIPTERGSLHPPHHKGGLAPVTRQFDDRVALVVHHVHVAVLVDRQADGPHGVPLQAADR